MLENKAISHKSAMDNLFGWNKTHISKLCDFFECYNNKEGIETMGLDKIKEYQICAINSTLRHVWDNNSYYRKSFEENKIIKPEISDLTQFSSFPLLKKDTIRGDKRLLLCVKPSEISQYHLTSGTNGKPIYTCHTLADQYIYEFLPKYDKLFPENDTDVIAIALPYECAFPGLGFQRLFQIAFGSTIISLGKGGYMASIEKSLKLMSEFKCTILTTTPSYAALLYEEAVKFGIDVKENIHLKRIILTGEGCSYVFRDRLEQLWNCEVSFFYGSTECGAIGIECKEHNGYHVPQGHVYVEIIDTNTKQILPYNQVGEIVVTTLVREGMPMIRYRTGDIGYLEKSNCKCGNNMDILHLRGRMENQIRINGSELSPFYLENVLVSVREVGLWYQIIIENNSLIIVIELEDRKYSKEKVISKVKNKLKEHLKFEFEVKVVDRIPRTYDKAQRILYK